MTVRQTVSAQPNLTDSCRELLVAKDLHFLAFHAVYVKVPTSLPEDIRGRRYRVSTAPKARLFAQAIGAAELPLGFSDIGPSLHMGLITAGETAVSLCARTGIAEEVLHFTLTHHEYGRVRYCEPEAVAEWLVGAGATTSHSSLP